MNFYITRDRQGLRITDFQPLPERYIAGPFREWNDAGEWLQQYRFNRKHRRITFGLVGMSLVFTLIVLGAL